MLVDWTYFGPAGGLGARARMRLKKRGRADWMDLEVVEVHPPTTSVEETVGAGGRRRTRGIYVLEEVPAGGTRVSFRFEWLSAPLIERLAAPMTRSVLRRGNQRSLERLAQRLTPVPQP